MNIEELEKILDEYEDKVGLPKFQKVEAPEYLTMNLDQLRRKTPDELSEAGFALNQYALYIQRLINRKRAWERWFYSKLDELAAHYIPQVGENYGFNERILMAKNNPDICKKINSLLRQTKMELERLNEIPQGVRDISNAIKDIKFAAIRREKDAHNE